MDMEKKRNRGILAKASIRLGLGVIMIVLIIFLPAGTISYWNGWLFCGALFIPMIIFLVYAFARMPDLLERRTRMKEKESKQKKIVYFSLPVFIAAFIVPGLDFRFGWSSVPLWLVIASTILAFSGYLIVIFTMVQNNYASRVIEVEKNQKVIDTGLYSVIRHPMYSGACILYVFSPLVLGSYWALIPAISIPVVLVLRILNEEEILSRDLPGYTDYVKKVKYRLVPFVW